MESNGLRESLLLLSEEHCRCYRYLEAECLLCCTYLLLAAALNIRFSVFSA